MASASYKCDKCKSRRALLARCSKSETKGVTVVLVLHEKAAFQPDQRTGREGEPPAGKAGLYSRIVHSSITRRNLKQQVTRHPMKKHRIRVKRLKDLRCLYGSTVVSLQ